MQALLHRTISCYRALKNSHINVWPSILVILLFVFTAPPPPVVAKKTEIKAADLVQENQVIDLGSKRYSQLFSDLKGKHQFNDQELQQLFQDLKIHRKVLVLMDKQWEGKPYYEYYPLFITPTVIFKGKQYLTKYKTLFDKIEAKFQVNREVIVAIWAIESRFGTNQGGFNMFRTLNTLFDAYPRRSDFFRKELINFLVLCKENDIDPLAVKGSYAGAFGQAQFMPSSFNSYAVDFDGDNKRDLINSMPDIFGSIANYLSTFGWKLDAPTYIDIGTKLNSEKLTDAYKQGRKGRVEWRYVAKVQQVTLPRPQDNKELSVVGLQKDPNKEGGMRFVVGYPNFHAITAYNHSNKYAMAVSEMIDAFTN